MFEIENGCLWIWEQQTDYLLEWFEDALPELVQQDDIIFEYNQYNQSRSKKSCTVFSAMGAISDLFNYKVGIDEAKKVDDMSYTRGRIKDSGRRVQSGVKLWADYRNENHSDLGQVAYYKIDLTDDDLVQKVLDKWYTIMTSFQWNMAYIKDYQADSILNWTDFGAWTFGHAINVRKIKGKRSCKDTAYWTDHNIYELQHTLREIKCYSTNGYIYTKVGEDALSEIKRLNELKCLVVKVIESNSSIRHLVNDTTYKNSLHNMNNENRKKLQDIETELRKYA